MWVRFRQPFRAVTETVHDARTKVLDNHIGPVQETLEQFSIARRLDIESNALLAAVEAHEIGRLIIDERAKRTRVVAAAKLLDLDYARAQVSQHHGSIRSG